MRFKDVDKIGNLLMEMPRWVSPVTNSTFDKLSNLPLEELLKYVERICTFRNISVNVLPSSDNNTNLIFIENEMMIAGYSYIKIDGHIKTTRSWSNPSMNGSFGKIFTNFILPTFNTIESDNKLSDKGFIFWKNLISKIPNLYYYVKNGEDIVQVSSPDELSKHFGNSVEFLSSSFIISINPL